MDKYEFINELQRHLTGKVSVQELQELTNYYNDYIDTEVRKGKSEADVLKSLGDPRLLAKSIVNAEKSGGNSPEDDYAYKYANETEETPGSQFVFNGHTLSAWQAKAIGFAVVVLLLLLLIGVFKILGFAIAIIIKVFLPILLPLGIIYVVYILFFAKK